MRMTISVCLFTTALMLAPSAMAHGELESSVPADMAVIHAAPAVLELNFDDPVKLTAVTLKVGDEEVPVEIDLSAAQAKTVSADLPELVPGAYTVEWRALGDDGHPMTGELTFILEY